MIELGSICHVPALGQYRDFARAAEALHLTQPILFRIFAAREHGENLRSHNIRFLAGREVEARQADAQPLHRQLLQPGVRSKARHGVFESTHG